MARLAWTVAALAGASAFSAPLPSSTGIRLRSGATVVQMGAPDKFLFKINNGITNGPGMKKDSMAPLVTIFDHRGCSRQTGEYGGAKTQTVEDEMLLKVGWTKIMPAPKEKCEKFLAETLATLKK